MNALNQLTNLAAQEGANRRIELQQEGQLKRQQAAADATLSREELRAREQQWKAIITEASKNPFMPSLDQFGIGTPKEDREGFLKAFAEAQKEERRTETFSGWVKQHRTGEDPGTLPAELGMTEEEIANHPRFGPFFQRAMEAYKQKQEDLRKKADADYKRVDMVYRRLNQDLEQAKAGFDDMATKDLTNYISSTSARAGTLQQQISQQLQFVAKLGQAVAVFSGDPSDPTYTALVDQHQDAQNRLSELQLELQGLRTPLDKAKQVLRERNNANPGSTETLDIDQLPAIVDTTLSKAIDDVMADEVFAPMVQAISTDQIRGAQETTLSPADVFLRTILATSYTGAPNDKALANLAVRQIASRVLARINSDPAFQGVDLQVLYDALRREFRRRAQAQAEQAKVGGIDTSWWPGQQPPGWVQNPNIPLPSPTEVAPNTGGQ
ncbi:MAG TPA: hypothetical protein ENK56_06590 [Chloroflexi bacterium]|nr:hypothetical protein [Chloroflexota bacterium]